jgi:predicted Zn-dependent protease
MNATESKRRRGHKKTKRPRGRRQPKHDRTQSIAKAEELLQAALERSPADETELVWIDATRSAARSRRRPEEENPIRETTLFVRILERGRLGSYRTGAWSGPEIDQAIRHAIAQSRTRGTLQGLPHLPADDRPAGPTEGLFDDAVANLDRKEASGLLKANRRKREVARLDWGQASVLVVNSRKLRRKASVTHCSLKVRCGRVPGSGHAASSARTLERLDAESVFERARSRHSSGEAVDPPQEKCPVVLAPEATVRLFSMLNQAAFTASAYHNGLSFLREHMGTQVFDRRINLRDDGTDETGLPFPFDLEGTAKQRVDLIVKGSPQTPALDQRQAALLGLKPTGHAIAGNDAQARNLFLEPGASTPAELLADVGNGVFVGWLESVECFDQPRVRFRTIARGVRTIESGELGVPLPDLIWEDNLLRVLSNLIGISSVPVTWSLEGFLGGITAPGLALADVVGLRPDLPV